MKYDFPTHEKGDTFNGVQFELMINGVEKDLTDVIINMTVNKKVFSTVTGELLITDALLGKFQFKKQIVTMPPKNYNYEIVFIFPNGDVKTYIEGTWKITL